MYMHLIELIISYFHVQKQKNLITIIGITTKSSKSNSHKYIYIPTGINPCSPKVGKSEVRQRYGIPEEAFVFCYVGRHNEIKGYDTLKELGLELLKDKMYTFGSRKGRTNKRFGAWQVDRGRLDK